jgi:hypothetical protein
MYRQLIKGRVETDYTRNTFVFVRVTKYTSLMNKMSLQQIK